MDFQYHICMIKPRLHDLALGGVWQPCSTELVSIQSRSQSFVPLDQRSENVSSGSNHYERTKEITEFWLSGSLRICIYGACLKWLLPELSFSDRWSRGTKLWERDWCRSTPLTMFVTKKRVVSRTKRADLFIVCYRSAGTSVADLQTIYR